MALPKSPIPGKNAPIRGTRAGPKRSSRGSSSGNPAQVGIDLVKSLKKKGEHFGNKILPGNPF